MSLSSSVALLAQTDLVKRTGEQLLANLEASTELEITDVILAAQQWVRKEIRVSADPDTITNETELTDAIAFETLSRLMRSVGRTEEADTYRALSVREIHGDPITKLGGFVPVYPAATDAGRRLGEGVPLVGHLSSRGVFFGGYDGQTFYDEDGLEVTT